MLQITLECKLRCLVERSLDTREKLKRFFRYAFLLFARQHYRDSGIVTKHLRIFKLVSTRVLREI